MIKICQNFLAGVFHYEIRRKMKIKREQVIHIARLCRLKLTEEEIEKFSQEFSEILSYMEKLNHLSTEKVKPLSHILPLENVLRKDEVKNSLPLNQVLANAPAHQDAFFQVPQIVKGEEE
jgi:aspartyl-tRNA(Asn)/glutamyl-tRNA(Gln) amidotransferase subunit C